MNISGNGQALAGTTTRLWRKWQDARESWRDQKSDEFEQKFLMELQAGVERAAPVLDKLAQILNQAREDCE